MKPFSQPLFALLTAVILMLFFSGLTYTATAQVNPSDFDMKMHKVVQGETLYSIARKYSVSPKDLREVNDLENPVVYPGLELIIPSQSDAQKMKEQEIATRSLQTPPTTPNLQSTSAQSGSLDQLGAYPGTATRSLDQAAAPALPYQVPAGKAAIFYTVQKGDDLFSISDSKGVTAAQLKAWNPNASYREGEQIIIGLRDASAGTSSMATRSISSTSAAPGQAVGDLGSLSPAGPQVTSFSVPEAGTRSITTLQAAPSSGSTPAAPASTSGGAFQMPELGKYGKTAIPNQSFEEYRGPRLANSRFYGLHKTIPVGTKANISLPGNGGFVQVEIVGQQPLNSPYDFALSPETIHLLNATPNTGRVTVAY